MPKLATCYRCNRVKDCSQRTFMLDILDGLGLTHAAFRCNLWRGDFLPGERVTATVWDFEEGDGYGGGGPYQDKRDATVLRIERGKFLVQLDEPVVFSRGGSMDEVWTQRVHRDCLSHIEESPKKLCECGYVDPCNPSVGFCYREFGTPSAIASLIKNSNRRTAPSPNRDGEIGKTE